MINACKDGGEVGVKTYNVKDMLTNVGNNIILPNYQTLADDVLVMKESIDNLKLNPSELTLTTAQDDFITAYKSWQTTSSYMYFGPAENLALITMNSFPTDVSRIEENISSSIYDLESGANTTAIGFPALDYLLFNGTATQVIQKLQNGNYSKYVTDVSAHISNTINTVSTTWKDTYINTFLEAKGTDAGSSISLLVNSMIHDFEAGGREAKIGVPAGVRTLNEVIPQNVEAFYSGNSILLAKEHIKAVKILFEGNGGLSFKGILAEVEKESLATKISTQFDDIITALDGLEDPFSSALENDNGMALSVYGEYQKLLPLLKVDLTAALGLLISYQDSDGD